MHKQLNQAHRGFIVVDQTNKICFVNPIAEKILGNNLINTRCALPIAVDKVTEIEMTGADGIKSTLELIALETKWEKQFAHLIFLRIIEPAQTESISEQVDYQAIVETHTDLICRFLPDTTLTFVNQAFCQHFTKQPEAILGYSFLTFIPKDFHQRILLEIQESILHPTTTTYDYSTDNPPQKICQIQWKNHPILNAEGAVIAFQMIGRDLAEKQKAKEALYQAYDRFTTVLDSLDAMVYVADMQTYEILFANQYAKNLFNSKLVGEICWKVLQKNKIEPCEFCSNDKLISPTGEPTGLYVWEFQNTVTQRWFYIQNRAIRWTDGRLVRLETATDITQRKQMEAALQESEARLIEAQRIARLGYWEWDIIEGREIWSEEMLRILGRSPQATPLTYEDFEKALHSEDYSYVMQAFEKSIIQNIPYQIAFRIVWSDSSVRYLQAFGKMVRDTEGRPLRFIGTAQDITEIKLVESALSDSEARYRSVVAVLREGIVLHNESGIIYECNPSAERILGLSRAEMIGHSPEEPHWATIHEDGSAFPCHTHPVMITLQTGLPVSEVTMGLCKPNGILWLSVNAQPLVNYRPSTFHTTHEMTKCQGVVVSFTDITNRKHAEDQLWRSQQRYKTLATASPVGLFETDRDGICMYVNDQTCQILQRSTTELLGSRWTHSLHPFDQDEVFFEWRQCVEYEEKFYRECRFQRPNGEVVWVVGQIAPSFNADNKLEGFVGTLTDITQLKRTEEQLQVAEAQYQMLVEYVPAVIYTASTDVRKTFFYISPQVELLLGFTTADWLNGEGLWCEQIHFEDREWVCTKHATAVSNARVFEAEYRLIKRTGAIVWVHDEAVIRLDRDDQPQVVQGVLMDISKRKYAEEALRESERYRRMLIEESQVGLGIFQLDGKISEVNTAFAKILGYTVQEIVNKLSCHAITPSYYFKSDRAQINQLKKTGRFGPYEKEFIHKTGQPVLVKLSGLLINDQSKVAIWVNMEDITEQRHIEEALRKAKEKAEVANHAKTAFLTNMSHELRTPLNSILGYTQILKRDKTLNMAQREGIDVIHRSGEYLLTLINDILDLSKIEANRVELYPADIQFTSFLKDIAELFQARAKEKAVIFNYEALSPLPSVVHVDEKRLRQILVNLLSNAFKFTKQGHVSLKVGVEDTPSHFVDLKKTGKQLQKIRFEVEDTGVGIAQEDVETIFLPFQQVGERDYWEQGTGLGLSITKKLVEMMGGQLQLKSIVGIGSLFWTTLELLTIQRTITTSQLEEPLITGYRITAQTRMRTLSTQSQKTKIKILVVDDKPENRLTLVNFLTPLGFKVLEAKEGRAGVEMVKKIKDIDVILMDLVMPMIDGFEATRQIKQLQSSKDLIIIAVSASIFDQHQQQSIEAGCNDFIPKPIRTEILLEKLKTHLRLEWIYETDSKFPALSKEDSITLLSQPQAEYLFHLAMMGDVYGIIDYIDALKKENANLVTLATKIEQLAKRFRTDEICAIAQSFLNSK